jgi:hypothetical protein
LEGGRAADVVSARDGESDEEVDCGDGVDLAILDVRDRSPVDCEFIDRPGARSPVRGTSALIRARGTFGLQLPSGPRWFAMPRIARIPTGSTIDPKAGVVRLTMATRRRGRQRLNVSRGSFELRQPAGSRASTELELAGRRPECHRSSSPAARASGVLDAPSSRSILVDAKPRRNRGGSRRPAERVVVRGPHSVAATRGTKWLTEERCDGTLTTVLSGSVRVRDKGLKEDVVVRPGRPYLARARPRGG